MSGAVADLESEWRKDAARFSPIAAADIFSDLVSRHSEPHRRYHGLSHLAALLDLLATHAPHVRPGSAARLAIWWHDAVYDPARRDNEDLSAVLARDHLARLGAPSSLAEETARIILITRDHWNGPPAGDGDFFLDADIAILGAPPGVYDAYAAAVRQEYAFVTDAAFGAGRGAFLTHALSLPRLFRTDAFQAAYVDQARANMSRERARLLGESS